MSKREKFENCMWGLPISPITKLKIVRNVNIMFNYFTGNSNLNNNVPLISSNSYYGHEYWLKRYSHWEKPICGVVEHGVYWGEDGGICGDEKDYIFKNIITFGNYREKCIKKGLSGYQVIKIGPRIAYAKTDINLLKQLEEKASGEKVLTLFPAHSLEGFKCEYDIDYLVSQAKNIMVKYKLKQLRVCLKEQDMVNGTAEIFNGRGCTVVTAGEASIDFLPRLRAIIEASDVTMSNSLGTHLGYCIYMGKPHILIRQDKMNSGFGEKYVQNLRIFNSISEKYKKEEEMFLKYFGCMDELRITDAQYSLCDYYWGFSCVKEPSVLYQIFRNIYGGE